MVEEKRSLIETQVKEQLYDLPDRPRVLGKKDENEQWLFHAKYALDPSDIAIKLGERLIRSGAGDDIKARVAELKRLKGNRPEAAEAATRIPYFCPGCPHNSSTVVPQGSRAYAGIGCHYMAHWMDRNTEGFTQMGGEGSNWIGEAPFSKTPHVFQNLGDGTYIHSGSLAIRAARAAGVNITFKILYNDAVAMTGGQSLDGGISVSMMPQPGAGRGRRRRPSSSPTSPTSIRRASFRAACPSTTARDLQRVQKELREVPGVSVLLYDQTCAAEKRRRRKRGLFPDPDKRVFINPAVCEGCGDCGVKSNCVAVVPLETELGTKRAIDQSACNKDFSCLNGFCPSFVTVHGAKVRKSRAAVRGDSGVTAMLASLPEPKQPSLDKPYTMLVTGVGGTGVVTVSALLGQAAHLEGKGFGAIDMTGLAQKGGAVACHMRVAKDAEQIHAIRAGVAGADLVLGCDLVVTASNEVLATIKPDHTAVVFSDYEMSTADFTRKADLKVPGAALRHAIAERAGKAPVHHFDAHTAAVKLFGDSIAANVFLLGYAYQLGCVPIGAAAIEQAIELNGAAVETSRTAFRFGRLAAHDMARGRAHHGRRRPSRQRSKAQTLEDIVAHRAAVLAAYQDAALAERYRARVAPMAEAEREQGGRAAAGLAEAVGARLLQAARLQGRVRGGAPLHRPGLREGALRAVRGARQARVPSGAAAARPPRQDHRRAAQDEVRALDAPRLPPARQGQAPARHRLGPVRLHPRAQAGAADDRRLRDAARRDRRAALARQPRRGRGAGVPAARDPRLRPHQGAQLQAGQGPRGGPAGRAAQPVSHDRAEGGGVRCQTLRV